MDAKKEFLLGFIQYNIQMSIPIYQRKYSWTYKEVEKLFNDILRIGKVKDEKSNYFIGSIVYMKYVSHIHHKIDDYKIIDGQQRVTTIMLLISAMVNHLNNNPNVELESPKKIIQDYLIHDNEEGDKRNRLVLTKDDAKAFNKIIENISAEKKVPFNENDSIRIKENYEYLVKKVNSKNIHIIYEGLRRLVAVFIGLESGVDSAQLIFESLNSTGLELNKSDLIKNYLLMDSTQEQQEKLYNNYWHEMDKTFENQSDLFDGFIKDYLTVKLNKIPKKKELYMDYKRYASNISNEDELIKDIYLYFNYYKKMAFGKEDDSKLNRAFLSLKSLGSSAFYPFLFQVYADYDNDNLTVDEFIEIINLIESYFLRRFICAISSSENYTFSKLYGEVKKIEEELELDFLDAFKFVLRIKEGKKRIPNNDEFKSAFLEYNIYKSDYEKYILNKLENYNSKEVTVIDNYTIEHIMPQNPNLPTCWREALGPNWEEIQDKWLHTIGNLTLTAYNSELSDKCFKEKRDMDGGFKDSPIRLNTSLKSLESWNEEEISKRANNLISVALNIWRYPQVDERLFKLYGEINRKGRVYKIEDIVALKSDSYIRPLFDELDSLIFKLDDGITRQPTSKYVSYLFSSKRFVSIYPTKKILKIGIHMPFDEIDDIENRCTDETDNDWWSSLNAILRMDTIDDLDYAINIIKQSFEYNFGGNILE